MGGPGSGRKKQLPACGYYSTLARKNYRMWINMRARCNPNYAKLNPRGNNYHKKGIKVCKEWEESYDTFRAWVKEKQKNFSGSWDRATLDRIDNSKGYNPENCQFLDRSDHQAKSNKERRAS